MSWEPDVSLATLARYRIGGPTPRLARPGSEDDLRARLREAGSTVRVLGTGANVLISDEGVPESVLVLNGDFDAMAVEENAIEVGAATRLPALAGAARRASRVGFHYLEAVPGTLGGGLRMNAGSREDWIWGQVEWAEAITGDGERVRVSPDDVSPRYRGVDVPEDWIFVAARLRAEPADPATVHGAHMNFRERKVEDQVYELPSVGSTWKNPVAPNPSAWEVVDAVGMRGARVGGAQIAERHANFIVNLGDARAEDVLELMAETRRRAHETMGLWLEPEIRLWGFAPEQLEQVGAS